MNQIYHYVGLFVFYLALFMFWFAFGYSVTYLLEAALKPSRLRGFLR